MNAAAARLVYAGSLIGGLFVLLFAWGCDTVEPVADAVLVVEGFIDTGKPLAPVILRQTRPLSTTYPLDATTAAEGAEVVLEADGRRIAYLPSEVPGRYVPSTTTPLRPETSFTLSVRWEGQEAVGRSKAPPPIRIDSVLIAAPNAPVQAILLDSLRLDSLDVGVYEGYIYPVEVSLWWQPPPEEAAADTLHWIRTRLRPHTSVSLSVTDFFLRPEQIVREHALQKAAGGRRQWTGVYAIPVPGATDPLPPHRLTVALLRSGQDYARFASSRDAPDRREPVSNVTGGIGIVAGIAVDSLQLDVSTSTVRIGRAP